MQLKWTILICLLTFKQILSDDYFLNEEEEKEATESSDPQNDSDFMRDFACLIGTNKFVTQNQPTLISFQDSSLFGLNLKRLRAKLFKLCHSEISEEIIRQVANSRSAEDFEQVFFHFFENFEFQEIFQNEDRKLNEEDAFLVKRIRSVEDKVKEIQKKQKRDNPDASERDEDGQTWDDVRNNKDAPGIFFLGLDSKILIGLTGFLSWVLCFAFYFAWKKLFPGTSFAQKKLAKKLKKEHSNRNDFSKDRSSKNLFKKPMPFFQKK